MANPKHCTPKRQLGGHQAAEAGQGGPGFFGARDGPPRSPALGSFSPTHKEQTKVPAGLLRRISSYSS